MHGYGVKMSNNVGSRALYSTEKVSFSYSSSAYNLQVYIFFLITYGCYIINSVQLKAEIFFVCVCVFCHYIQVQL